MQRWSALGDVLSRRALDAGGDAVPDCAEGAGRERRLRAADVPAEPGVRFNSGLDLLTSKLGRLALPLSCARNCCIFLPSMQLALAVFVGHKYRVGELKNRLENGIV